MDKQKEAYKIEAYELLAELEISLLELESDPHNAHLVDRVFRAMHTIKGSGAMFGFDDIAEFTHDVESVFEMVRNDQVPVNTDLVNLALRARDHIKSLLDHAADPKAIDQEEGLSILRGFRAVSAADRPQGAARSVEKQADDPSPAGHAGEKLFHIRFSPHETLFQNGTNPLALLSELTRMGDCRTTLHSDRIPAAEHFDPEKCYLYWDILLKTDKDIEDIKDVFIFTEGACELNIERIDDASNAGDRPSVRKLGEILVDRGDLAPEKVQAALKGQKRIGQILVESSAVSSEKVRSALHEQEMLASVRARRERQITSTSVRVGAEKLDTLVNLVGEMVTVQARLSRKAMLAGDPELLSISETVERLIAELRDNTLRIRMLPIEVTFSNLRRMVRDLSKEMGKPILLKTEGGETELDKTVLDQLNDPLVHILRNCVDHGIESPEVRRQAGKPDQGVIRLKAEHSGAHVFIHISDDGAGIDPALIRRKAIEKGLIAPDADRTDKELLQLIFLPGFSMAESVTSISGRGVGMDVVKRSLDTLRGAVDVTAAPGQGTTITLKLPLTLAIIDGLLVEIGTEKYVLPLSPIEQCVELTRDHLALANGRNILNIRGQIVPFVPLRERFGILGEPPVIEQVVINEIEGRRVGIVVDRVIGEHQIVIKTMNALYKEVHEISGATILGDGTVALILDVPRLIEEYQ
jgi:two-component system, chemotaxis family, sensor kinase CheA